MLRFVTRMRELTAEVGHGMAEQSGGDDLAALVRAVIQRRAGRRYQLSSGTHYAVHGIGCRIVGTDGTVVDVDVAADGETLVFDAWRVLWFGESIRASGFDEQSIGVALHALADDGALTAMDTEGRWYRPGGVRQDVRASRS